MKNLKMFCTEEDKKNIVVGFPKDIFTKYQGVNGLKYILIVMYLRKHLQVFGKVGMTFNDMVAECGFSTNSRNSFAYYHFREILCRLQNEGYITTNCDLTTIPPGKFFEIQISAENNLFITDSNFVTLSVDAFEKIASVNSTVNKTLLAGVYLYIKQYISNDSHSIKLAYPTKKTIMDGIGIGNEGTLDRILLTLQKLGLIYIGKGFFRKSQADPNAFIKVRNVYAFNKEDLNDNDCIAVLESFYKTKIYKDFNH